MVVPVFGATDATLFIPVAHPTAVVPYGAVPGIVLDIAPLFIATDAVVEQYMVCVPFAVVLATVPVALFEYLNVAVTVFVSVVQKVVIDVAEACANVYPVPPLLLADVNLLKPYPDTIVGFVSVTPVFEVDKCIVYTAAPVAAMTPVL